MSQTYTQDCFAGGHVYSTDMGNMKNNFAALKSLFSGSSAPSSPTPVAGQPWADTSKKVLKYRNAGAAAWVGVMHSDGVNQVLWFYVNSAMDGYIVFPWVSDKVLAVKGGSTYVSGGSWSGTFSLSLLDHNHKYLTNNGVYQQQTYDSGGNVVSVSGVSISTGTYVLSGPNAYHYAMEETWTKMSSLGSWRPAAAVGTLQVLDFT